MHSIKKFTVGDFFIYGVLGVISVVSILPFLYILSVSFTDPDTYVPLQFYIIPKAFSLKSYRYVLSTPSFFNAFKSTVFITVVGTAVNLIVTFAMAWGLTKKEVPGHKIFFYMVVVTLFFNAGHIPSYLLVQNLKLMNSHWALILTSMTSACNLIVVKNFLQTIPEEIIESAQMDGCGELRVFGLIVLPLSKPCIATFLLFFAVKHWNTYFNALLYLSDTTKWTLQLLIKQLVVDADASGIGQALTAEAVPPQETVRMASIILAILPIMIVYPFLQKHFAKGVMLGSIKG